MAIHSLLTYITFFRLFVQFASKKKKQNKEKRKKSSEQKNVSNLFGKTFCEDSNYSTND